MRQAGKAKLFCDALASNDFEPSCQFETLCRKKEGSVTSTVAPSLTPSTCGGQDVVEMLFKKVGNMVFDAEDLDDVETGRKVQEVVGISVADAILLCKKTTRQAEGASWYDERSKRITFSNFGRVIKRRKNIAPISIVNMITSSGGKRTSNLPASLQWGITNEAVAVKRCADATFENEESLKIESRGLVVSVKLPWLGCSPSRGGIPVGCIEVKCPYAKRAMLLNKAAEEDKSFFLQSTDSMLQLKRNHAYYFQCQGAMNILNLPWIDFIVYTEVDLHVQRIQRDTSLWENKMVPELTDFFLKYILPKFMYLDVCNC